MYVINTSSYELAQLQSAPLHQYFSWHDNVIDQHIDTLLEKGFVVLDQIYQQAFLQQLYDESSHELGSFRPAAIQHGVNAHIRNDHILWIEPHLSAAQIHLTTLDWIAQILNRKLFLGLRHIEGHYACYQRGQFYGLHRDNPQAKNGRVISTVFYYCDEADLSRAGAAQWGGQLRLQDRQNQWHDLYPIPNRLVLFESDLLHAVEMTHAKRWSLTAWLRQD